MDYCYFTLLLVAIIYYLSDCVETACNSTQNIEVMEGESFIPTTNNCIECICINSKPVNCQDVGCLTPITNDCGKYGYGRSCCNFMCRMLNESTNEDNEEIQFVDHESNVTQTIVGKLMECLKLLRTLISSNTGHSL